MADTPGTIILGHLNRTMDDASTGARTPADGVTWTDDTASYEGFFCYDARILERDLDAVSVFTEYDIEPFDLYANSTTTFADVKLALVFKLVTLTDTYEMIVYCGHGLDDFETHDSILRSLEGLLEDSAVVFGFSAYTDTTTPEPIDEWSTADSGNDNYMIGSASDLLAEANTYDAGSVSVANYVAYASRALSDTERNTAVDDINNRTTTGHQILAIGNYETAYWSGDSTNPYGIRTTLPSEWIDALGRLGAQGSSVDNGDDDSDTSASIQAFLGSIGGADAGSGSIERQDQSRMEAE